MTIKQYEEREKRLSARVSRLKSSIAKAKMQVTEGNIPAKAEEINSLEIQLKLTETAHENVLKQLQEQEKFLASKEYKDKLKQQEKLRKQATQGTASILEKLVEVQQQAKEVFKLCKQYNKLNRETSKFDNTFSYYMNLEMKLPFSWLQMVFKNVNGFVKRAESMKDKLEV